jgi:hypothetical protein
VTEGVEFRHLGQAGRIARYPVHWHHRKDAPGQYIKRFECYHPYRVKLMDFRSSVHTSYSRGVVVHDTNYVLVEQTVNYDVLGHSVYLEDGIIRIQFVVLTASTGTEIGNQFINNLAITSR